MTDVDVDAALARAEAAVASRRSLRRTGFWPAVDAVKRDRALVERYADRIATIDRRAFENGVKLRLPAPIGMLGLVLMSAFGVCALVVASRASDASWLVPVAFLAGFGAVLVGTHCLAHWIVGRLLGIRFTHVFLGGPPPPRPGLKTDYATYLRAPARGRAVMHASGAVLTKLVPFALLPLSIGLDDRWSLLTWFLLVVGVLQIVTDVVLSTKVSDWKKVGRELRIARS